MTLEQRKIKSLELRMDHIEKRVVTGINVPPMAYELASCPNCGISVIIPKTLFDRRSEKGRPFYCSSGHKFSYQ